MTDEKDLTPFEAWQMKTYGNILPEQQSFEVFENTEDNEKQVNKYFELQNLNHDSETY
jgi:hypothetical protein